MTDNDLARWELILIGEEGPVYDGEFEYECSEELALALIAQVREARSDCRILCDRLKLYMGDVLSGSAIAARIERWSEG